MLNDWTSNLSDFVLEIVQNFGEHISSTLQAIACQISEQCQDFTPVVHILCWSRFWDWWITLLAEAMKTDPNLSVDSGGYSISQNMYLAQGSAITS